MRKKQCLALLLLLALLGCLAGCGEPPLAQIPRSTGAPQGIQEILWIPPGGLTGLEGMLETTGGSGTPDGATLDLLSSHADGNGTTMALLETFGDGHQLNILYSLTLPSTGRQPTNEELTALIYLAPAFSPLTYREYSTRAVSYDPDTRCLYCFASVSFDGPGYTNQALTFRLSDTDQPGQEGVHCSVTWTPHNKAPHRTAQDKGGSCTISPLSLSISLPISVEAIQDPLSPTDPLTSVQESVKLVYQDGSVLDNFGGGWEADPIKVLNAKPPSGIFRLDALDHVEILDYTFVFDGQEGGPP